MIGQNQLEVNLARRWHTFGGRRIENPQEGATAASPFVCRNVGGPPCLVGLHVQDCIAEGTWGNEILTFWLHFGQYFCKGNPESYPKISLIFWLQFRTPQRLKNEAGGSKNETQTLSNRGPETSKIESKAFQNAIFRVI